MEIKELAQLVVTSTVKSESKGMNYYMTNINHPVIAELKKRYCRVENINPSIPLSDQQRSEFELWLFQQSVRKTIETICTQQNNEMRENHGNAETAP